MLAEQPRRPFPQELLPRVMQDAVEGAIEGTEHLWEDVYDLIDRARLPLDVQERLMPIFEKILELQKVQIRLGAACGLAAAWSEAARAPVAVTAVRPVEHRCRQLRRRKVA